MSATQLSRIWRLVLLTGAANGDSYALDVTVTVDATSGSVTNSATVSVPPGTNDPDPSNDTDDDQNQIQPQADLAVTKDDGNSTVATGDSVTYRVEVTNNGPDGVSGADLVDPAVAGLTKTAVACAASTPGNCVSAPTIANLETGFILPTLANGDSHALDVAAVDATGVTNSATVSAPGDQRSRPQQ